MQCALLPIPFPLSSCSLDAFFLRGESRTADPLASCPSPNRCLPRLSEERDGWTLSDISDRPMRSQASAAAPMGVRRRARFPGSREGQAGPPAAAESSALTLPAAAPATPRGSGGGAVPLPALLPDAGLGHLPSPAAAQLPVARAPAPARLMPPGAERAGGPVAVGR